MTKGFDAIWVIIDHQTKSAHFLTIRESSSAEKLANVYVCNIVTRHGVAVSIVSNRDMRFTYQFLQRFHEKLGMILHISTTYHPHTDGQTEWTI